MTTDAGARVRKKANTEWVYKVAVPRLIPGLPYLTNCSTNITITLIILKEAKLMNELLRVVGVQTFIILLQHKNTNLR